MIDEIRRRIERMPFVPFSVRTSDGHEYSVPTVDHVFITPRGNRVIVVTDDGSSALLGALHINRLVDQPNGA
jgi:hypothetical protein